MKKEVLSGEYIAGFIDGEGYIGIVKSRHPSMKNPAYHLEVCVSQASEGILYLFQFTFGGGVYE